MSISAQGRSRLNCVCRWRSGFCSEVEPGDPHLRGRERVHPGDHADAGLGGVRLEADLADRLRVLDDRPVGDAHRDRRLGVERARDLSRVLVDLPEHLVPVELLAPGQEPDLAVAERLRRHRGDPDRGRSLLIGFPHGGETAREDRLGRVGDRLRRVGDRRRAGARPTRRSRSPRCTPRPTPASRSSTPRTSTATGAPSASSRACCGSATSGSSSRPSSARRAPLDPALYTYENLRGWLERSRENLGVETVDLVQLHCPPWDTYYMPEVLEACERLVRGGPRPRLRRQRREGRGGAEGDRVHGRRDGPDHLQHAPAAARGALLRRRRSGATSA